MNLRVNTAAKNLQLKLTISNLSSKIGKTVVGRTHELIGEQELTIPATWLDHVSLATVAKEQSRSDKDRASGGHLVGNAKGAI